MVATGRPVIVVPMFEPEMMPCARRNTTMPAKRPCRGARVRTASRLRSDTPAAVSRPSVNLPTASRNRPSPLRQHADDDDRILRDFEIDSRLAIVSARSIAGYQFLRAGYSIGSIRIRIAERNVNRLFNNNVDKT